MGHHSIDLDLDGALAPPYACPACATPDLRPVCGEQGLLFLCTGCSRTWAWELGALLPAEPPEAVASQRPGTAP